MNTPNKDKKQLEDLDLGPDADADAIEDLEVGADETDNAKGGQARVPGQAGRSNARVT